MDVIAEELALPVMLSMMDVIIINIIISIIIYIPSKLMEAHPTS